MRYILKLLSIAFICLSCQAEPLEMLPVITDEEVELISLVTMAEAGGECEEGKRLVIDTILNRKDSEHFPDTIHDVIYQKNQYAPAWSKNKIPEKTLKEINRLVREEAESRTNEDVIFFRTKHYIEYGEPLFQVGNHYFSRY